MPRSEPKTFAYWKATHAHPAPPGRRSPPRTAEQARAVSRLHVPAALDVQRRHDILGGASKDLCNRSASHGDLLLQFRQSDSRQQHRCGWSLRAKPGVINGLIRTGRKLISPAVEKPRTSARTESARCDDGRARSQSAKRASSPHRYARCLTQTATTWRVQAIFPLLLVTHEPHALRRCGQTPRESTSQRLPDATSCRRSPRHAHNHKKQCLNAQ